MGGSAPQRCPSCHVGPDQNCCSRCRWSLWCKGWYPRWAPSPWLRGTQRVALVLLGSLPAPWQVLQPFGLGWALAMRSYPAGFLSPSQVAAVSVAGCAVCLQCGEDEFLPVYFFRRCHQMCWGLRQKDTHYSSVFHPLGVAAVGSRLPTRCHACVWRPCGSTGVAAGEPLE